MKKLFILLLLLVYPLINNCTKVENLFDVIYQDDFALYLLADTSLLATDVSQLKLDTLNLGINPLLNLVELNYYNWKDHSFSVTNKVIEKLTQIVRNRL